MKIIFIMKTSSFNPFFASHTAEVATWQQQDYEGVKSNTKILLHISHLTMVKYDDDDDDDDGPEAININNSFKSGSPLDLYPQFCASAHLSQDMVADACGIPMASLERTPWIEVSAYTARAKGL